MHDFESTAEIKLPSDPFERIIGQKEVIQLARVMARQRRHFLLVGPPGTGKSMIAHAISSILPKPTKEISVLHNSSQPERPFVEILRADQIKSDSRLQPLGKVIDVSDAPVFVAERLGLRCQRCGAKSSYTDAICSICSAEKTNYFVESESSGSAVQSNSIVTIRRTPDNKQEQVVYERRSDNTILMLTQNEVEKWNELNAKKQRRVIIPLNRPLFVQASGGSETELLGDIRHDPYGGQPPLGVLPYLRVLPGAIHEAHEGVLFIDELATLGNIQKQLLTAMQDKVFPIVGRNPTSSGAAVRVDAVPCDFILVGSANITDLPLIAPSLRSRVRGNGYEVLMESIMEDNEENRSKIAQFVAQEIVNDGRIPFADRSAVEEIINEAKHIANKLDDKIGITLRLRNLAGIIKLAGDIAKAEGAELISKPHISAAIKNSMNIEEKIEKTYGSIWSASRSDFEIKNRAPPGPETA